MRVLRMVLMCALAVVMSACGGEEPVAISDTQPVEEATDEESTEADTEDDTTASLRVTGVDLDIFCPALDRITTTYIDAEALAFTPGQLDAQDQLVTDADEILFELGSSYPELAEAVATLQIDGLIFGTAGDTQVEPDELDAAGSLAIETWNTNCADYEPGAVEESGSTSASDDGPDPGSYGADGQEDEFDAECPAPEVLESEGLECDEYGNTYPADTYSGDDQFDEECPSPETLEAEGLECDEYGNVYPADTYSDGHGDGSEEFGGDGCEGDDCYGDDYGEPNPDEFGADGCEGDDCYGGDYGEPNPDEFGADGCEGDDC